MAASVEGMAQATVAGNAESRREGNWRDKQINTAALSPDDLKHWLRGSYIYIYIYFQIIFIYVYIYMLHFILFF